LYSGERINPAVLRADSLELLKRPVGAIMGNLDAGRPGNISPSQLLEQLSPISSPSVTWRISALRVNIKRDPSLQAWISLLNTKFY
jgi:hypothetical protein